ncbi:hypothetical protein N1851_014035 [Merluccius polli]|uniref:Uncharacterized protein n=1 Tax=Merluccius polli TaxID=89951 RepID=A0AA47MU20_MERPO|nr:hypothetical protein N1851_014035 [Merluccius polli]
MTTETKRSYFNVLELEVLMLAYGEYEHIFYRRCNTAAAAKERETQGRTLLPESTCNSTGEKRTWKQLKMKHKNIIQNANRKKAEARKTGGGPPPPPLTEAEELALSQNRGHPVAEGIPGGSSSEFVTPEEEEEDDCLLPQGEIRRGLLKCVLILLWGGVVHQPQGGAVERARESRASSVLDPGERRPEHTGRRPEPELGPRRRQWTGRMEAQQPMNTLAQMLAEVAAMNRDQAVLSLACWTRESGDPSTRVGDRSQSWARGDDSVRHNCIGN